MQRNMAEKPEPKQSSSKRNLREPRSGASNATASRDVICRTTDQMMDAVVERKNMKAAYDRVVRNKGAAGTDGMTVDELKPYIREQWERIKSELVSDRYHPRSVLAVEIPKSDGGVRMLGIPVVVDRMICQGLHQILNPIFEPEFSANSYGFIVGRSAHQAILQAKRYVEEGYSWVVDIDIAKFFDRVNHDILMSFIARKVTDKRVLRLVRRYLQAGIMIDGVETPRQEGTPQGSPLSPLLSNILLDVLDKELERRGHKFVRYADDCNVYVKSEASAVRVMASLEEFLWKKLKLTVNKEKSRIGRPWEIKFLGYSFMVKGGKPLLSIAPETEKRLKEAVKEICSSGRGRSIQRVIADLNKKLHGWANYFKLSEVRRQLEILDGWIRRKVRCIIWRQWKIWKCRLKKLMQRGLDKVRARKSAGNGRGPWWNAGQSHMNQAFPKRYFDENGLVSLYDKIIGCRNI
jgi:RNA-directed DNA polymerase